MWPPYQALSRRAGHRDARGCDSIPGRALWPRTTVLSHDEPRGRDEEEAEAMRHVSRKMWILTVAVLAHSLPRARTGKYSPSMTKIEEP